MRMIKKEQSRGERWSHRDLEEEDRGAEEREQRRKEMVEEERDAEERHRGAKEERDRNMGGGEG